ncbi:MAG TPA: 6-phosphogluconolactonase [Kineosporiaceae bacterium]|nr:6-phosphogluconolactonase [Kineosporiaceae bacterium]
MSAPLVVVHATAELLVQAAAARLVTRLVDVQAATGHAHVVLTGGGTGIATLAAVAATPARDAVDWSALDVWWGDERFLPSGHPDRNETQARAALLDHVPLPPHRVHPMPPSDGPFGADVDAAAEAYAAELAAATRPEDHADVPSFDVLLLGLGPDAHIASLFPEHPALYEEDRSVLGVRGSPKPPPVRITLTRRAIQQAQDVWLVVAGADKAGAVSMALGQAGEVAVPAAAARGRRGTLWLLDRAAAAQVPPALTRPASP